MAKEENKNGQVDQTEYVFDLSDLTAGDVEMLNGNNMRSQWGVFARIVVSAPFDGDLSDPDTYRKVKWLDYRKLQKSFMAELGKLGG